MGYWRNGQYVGQDPAGAAGAGVEMSSPYEFSSNMNPQPAQWNQYGMDRGRSFGIEQNPSPGDNLASYDKYINLRNQQNAQPQQNMYSSPYDMFGQMAQKAAAIRKQVEYYRNQTQLNDAQNKAFWANNKLDKEIRGNFANLSKQGLADIGQRYDSERGRIAQEAVSRGLTGTTIPGAQRLASTRSQTADENNWRDQQAQQLNQYLASINNNYQNPNAVYQMFQNYGYG